MSDFEALSARLQRKIDQAFDRVAGSIDSSKARTPSKKRSPAPSSSKSLNVDPEEDGGFLLDDEGDEGGGFLPEEPQGEPIDLEGSKSGGGIEAIAFTRIPKALQYLDLPPDDGEVLEIFRNAASGWGEASMGAEPGVRREDWREVCAVLLAPREATASPKDAGIGSAEDGDDDELDGFLPEEDEDEAASDEYHDQDSKEEDNESDDSDFTLSRKTRSTRYRPAPTASTSKAALGRSRKRRRASTVSSGASEHEMTTRQRAEARKAFALFFPDVPSDSPDLVMKRIMIKDISRVASLLNEKIKIEEIVEMLEAFSSSPDKSVSLTDFERMCMAAHLV